MTKDVPDGGRLGQHNGSFADPTDTVWYAPPRARGIALGVALTAVTLLVSVSALITFSYRYPAPAAVLYFGLGLAGIIATGLAALWTIGLATLRYAVRGAAAYVQWGSTLLRIPLGAAEIVPATEAEPLGRRRGLLWPGSSIGFAENDRFGVVALAATDPAPDRLLLLVTPSLTVGLTIPPESDFAERLRQARGSRRAVEEPVAFTGFWRSLALWDDRLFWSTVGLGALIALLNWGVALGQAGQVGDTIRYLGSIRIEGPDDLVALAAVGAAIWSVDLVAGSLLHAWDAFAARFLAVAGVASQSVVLIALTSLGG